MYIKKTQQEILVNAFNRLQTYAGNKFTLSNNSVARAMLDTISSEIARLSDAMASSILNKTIDTASGAALDMFGVILQLPRKGETTTLDDTSSTIKFYIDPGFGFTAQTLVNMIPGTITSSYINRTNGSFTIKAGTRLYTSGQISFITSNDCTIVGTNTYAFVNATANMAGSSGNVDENGIIAHNINTNQIELENIAPYILVTNIAPISSGQDVESDANYRARLSQTIIGGVSSNEVALRLAAMSVPGVAAVEIIKFINGLGTTGIEITTTSPIANVGTIRQVYNRCSRVLACGEELIVIEPEYNAVSMRIELVGFGSTISTTVKNQIEQAIIDYILNIEKGGTIYTSKIIDLSFISSDIKDVNISQMSIGDLDIRSGSILNTYPINPGNIACSMYEKWYTDGSLIEVCDAV